MSTFCDRIGQADGANLLDRRVHERQHHIEVVDHQVENDVHVERTRREDAEPVHLEEHGLGEQRNGRAHRGIEALQMAGLGDAAVVAGERDQFIGFGNAGRQRLLDQDIDPALHQLAGDFTMRDGRHRNRCRLHSDSDHLVERAEGLRLELGGDGLRAGEVTIGNSHELNILLRVGLQVAIHAGVIAAKGSGSGDSDAQGVAAIRHAVIVAHGRGAKQKAANADRSR